MKNEKTPSVSVKIAIENGPFIVDLPSLQNGGSFHNYVSYQRALDILVGINCLH